MDTFPLYTRSQNIQASSIPVAKSLVFHLDGALSPNEQTPEEELKWLPSK